MAKALQKYAAKRNFAVTPEPSADSVGTSAEGTRFMVHKHDATRLHYDIRLEMNGVLASWACPKGPSYDPAQKWLAVELKITRWRMPISRAAFPTANTAPMTR